MRDTLKRLFTNDRFFTMVAMLGFAGELLYGIICLVLYPYAFAWDVMIILEGICTLLLFLSYKKHDKNVMKALMSAILMAMICNALCGMRTPAFSIDFVFSIIQLIIILMLFINHLAINSEHRASPKKVFLNQILCGCLTILIIIWDISWIVDITFIICNIVGHTCVVATIVCVESRLDAYRIDREAAGWTEEAGYPDGYVHKYQKK